MSSVFVSIIMGSDSDLPVMQACIDTLKSLKTVIGVPMDGGPLQGMDALLSTVQMPGGIPVATVAIGKAGAKNAAYLAAQMMALSDDALAIRLTDEREKNAKAVVAKDAEVQKQF